MLWKKVGRGLSAGRVQSVATRIIVQRERERMAFRSANYWDVLAELDASVSDPNATPARFNARMVTVDGKRVAIGRDFDSLGWSASQARCWCSTRPRPLRWPTGCAVRL